MFSLFPCDETRLTRPQMFLSLLLIWRSQKESRVKKSSQKSRVRKSQGEHWHEKWCEGEKRDGRWSFFSLFLLSLLLSSPFTLLAWKKKMTIQVSEYTVLPMLVSKKKPAITSLRPHSKMVNNPFFLIKSNPVNTVPNGPKKFGGINGWPY